MLCSVGDSSQFDLFDVIVEVVSTAKKVEEATKDAEQAVDEVGNFFIDAGQSIKNVFYPKSMENFFDCFSERYEKSGLWSSLGCIFGDDTLFFVEVMLIISLVIGSLYVYLMFPCIKIPLDLLIKAFFTVLCAGCSRCCGFCSKKLREVKASRLQPSVEKHKTEFPTVHHKVRSDDSWIKQETLV